MAGTAKQNPWVISSICLFAFLFFLQLVPRPILTISDATCFTEPFGWPFPFWEWKLENGSASDPDFHLTSFFVDLTVVASVFFSLLLSMVYICNQRALYISDLLALLLSLSLSIVLYQNATRIAIGLRRPIGRYLQVSDSWIWPSLLLLAFLLVSYTFSSAIFRNFGVRQGVSE